MAEAFLSDAVALIGTSALAALETNTAVVSIFASAIAAGETSPADISSLIDNTSIQAIINSALGTTLLSTGSTPTAATEASVTGSMTTTSQKSQVAVSGQRTGMTPAGTAQVTNTATAAATSSGAASSTKSSWTIRQYLFAATCTGLAGFLGVIAV